jgi:REP-associated tyrosine transposase
VKPVGTFEANACILKSPTLGKKGGDFFVTAVRRVIRTLSHCFYDCKYHVVWTPKYRGKIFVDPYVIGEVKRIILSVCKWKGFEVFELNIQEDHVHLVVGIDPRHSISYAMSIIKGKSSKWIKKKNYQRVKGLTDKGSLWARGYFVSTIGMDEHIIRRYVRYQTRKNQVDQPRLWED